MSMDDPASNAAVRDTDMPDAAEDDQDLQLGLSLQFPLLDDLTGRHLLMNHGTDDRKSKHSLGRRDGKKSPFWEHLSCPCIAAFFNLRSRIG